MQLIPPKTIRRIRILILVTGGLVTLVVACVALWLMFSGPRMKTQPKVMTYEAAFPPLPEGVVPVESHYAAAPTIAEAKTMENPLKETAKTLATGKVYYGYYCLFCHGETGRGDGPVGESYMPTPADLTSDASASLTEGELYRQMLIGPGHEPVLEYVIAESHRWYLVTYIRYLQSQLQPSTASRPTGLNMPE